MNPHNYIHTQSFNEVAQGFALALNASLVFDHNLVDTKKRTLVFGANVLAHGTALPANWVLYNGEQVDGGSVWFTDSYYLHLLKTHEVWDYSAVNVEMLHKLGVEASHVPVGWYEGWPKLPPASSEGPYLIPGEEPIDVLFYGSLNPRRAKIVEELRERGVEAVVAFGAYGYERDALIARSKLVLNVHYYAAKIFEIFRCAHLMANRVCVVSETGLDKKLEEKYDAGIAFAEYDCLVDRCVALLADNVGRERIAQRGFELFSSVTQAEYLKGVV